MVEAGHATMHCGEVDQQVHFGEDVELYDGWLGADSDQLIAEAELIAGVPCVRIAAVVAMKEQLDRPKDREHLAQIARYMAGER